MKIVLVLPTSPYPVTRGTGRLIMTMLEGLSRRHEVILVTMTYNKAELELLRGIESDRVSVRAMVLPHRRSLAKRIWYKIVNLVRLLFAGIPMEVSYSAPSEFLSLAARTAHEEDADMVLASYWHLYRLPGMVGTGKKILITHDLDYTARRNGISLMRKGARRWVELVLHRLRERIEIEAYRRFDAIVTVTGDDASALAGDERLAGKRIFTLPHALDLGEFSPEGFDRKEDTLLMMGTFLSGFNVDALSFFLSDVFPEILKKRPSVRLKVVGQGVPQKIVRRAGKNVDFLGLVSDIRMSLGECAVMVLPLRFAGGVRIRMLEAAAMGTPVVSTPAGVGGMGLIPGREYLEASGAAEMGDCVIRLLEDRELARRVGSAARSWALENLSMDDYPERLERLLLSL